MLFSLQICKTVCKDYSWKLCGCNHWPVVSECMSWLKVVFVVHCSSLTSTSLWMRFKKNKTTNVWSCHIDLDGFILELSKPGVSGNLLWQDKTHREMQNGIAGAENRWGISFFLSWRQEVWIKTGFFNLNTSPKEIIVWNNLALLLTAPNCQ